MRLPCKRTLAPEDRRTGWHFKQVFLSHFHIYTGLIGRTTISNNSIEYTLRVVIMDSMQVPGNHKKRQPYRKGTEHKWIWWTMDDKWWVMVVPFWLSLRNALIVIDKVHSAPMHRKHEPATPPPSDYYEFIVPFSKSCGRVV